MRIATITKTSKPRTRETHRMVVVDDHQAVRELLSTILVKESTRPLEVVGEAGSGPFALEVCRAVKPDLVILDMFLPGMNGVEVLAALRAQQPRLRVIFFSGCVQEPLIAQAVAEGADGYVLKTQPLKSLLDAVERVCDGGKYFDPSLTRLNDRMAILPGWQTLTNREREVIKLIAEGNTTKEAANRLGISVKTLDKHRSHMMKKLGVHDAVSVTRYAISAGLISLA